MGWILRNHNFNFQFFVKNIFLLELGIEKDIYSEVHFNKDTITHIFIV